MIIINFWTSQYYERNQWDKYYCKDEESVSPKIKELLEEEDYFSDNEIDTIMKPWNDYINQDYRWLPNLEYKTGNVNYEDLYIGLEYEDLI